MQWMSGQSTPIPNEIVAITSFNVPFGVLNDFIMLSLFSGFDTRVYISTIRNSERSGYPGGSVSLSPSLCLKVMYKLEQSQDCLQNITVLGKFNPFSVISSDILVVS